MASDKLLLDKLNKVVSLKEKSNVSNKSNFNLFLKPKVLTEIKWISLDFSYCQLPNSEGDFVTSTNKEILRYVAQYQQVHQAVPENSWPDKDGVLSEYTCPLEVTLILGRRQRVFNVMDQRRHDYSRRHDVYIQTHNIDYPGTQASTKYPQIIAHLKSSDKSVEAERARLILNSLERTPGFQIEWELAKINDQPVFTAQQVRAAIELIALTHVTECTPSPDSDYKENIGRYTADKWARSVFRAIVNDPDVTFETAFHANTALFLPARSGGKDVAKKIVTGKVNPKGALRAVLLDMSDDSDEE